ncbi:hypothetical protein DPEC_G00193530 [Dallia pectoralis]|uniref:Uncharacterized protein n=1 Tax=Dallia pectoralis TaxID=75939 RepID=A0ACC2G6I6_DALPE|nr:hypothetical protein DPEC_G00193530 [Dallia pectoralis]
MNTALRHWKEAATVILAAGRKHKLTGDTLPRRVDTIPGRVDTIPGRVDKANPVKPDSNLPDKSDFDYDVLLLKRSGTSGFMPNAYVFPGGVVEASDFSSEWMDVFKTFRHLPNFGLGFVKQPRETRPPIFATDRVMLGSPIPGDVGFRICAVRETFEESGVLLLVPKDQEMNVMDSIEDKTGGQPGLTRTTEICKDDLAKWRVLVNENPSNFIKMCRELECLPNIWALREWGNWLTPKGLHGKQRRYDTAFYMCCLQEKPPHTFQDEQEIVHAKWTTPPEVLQSYRDRDLWIAPPQFYDLSRLCRFPFLLDLHSFSTLRAAEGCERWLPVRMVSGKNFVALLPGDELYPEERSDQMNPVNTNQRLDKHLDEGSALHRLVLADSYSVDIHVTIPPKYRHMLPVTGPSLKPKYSSHL